MPWHFNILYFKKMGDNPIIHTFLINYVQVDGFFTKFLRCSLFWFRTRVQISGSIVHSLFEVWVGVHVNIDQYEVIINNDKFWKKFSNQDKKKIWESHCVQIKKKIIYLLRKELHYVSVQFMMTLNKDKRSDMSPRFWHVWWVIFSQVWWVVIW